MWKNTLPLGHTAARKVNKAIKSRYNAAQQTRKSGRVVDCNGLENRRLARVREFESHLFRHAPHKSATRRFFIGCVRAKELES